MTDVRILVDADACPVKEEIYRVALRLQVPVTIVSNAFLRIPAHALIDRVVVGSSFDAADDWIEERAGAGTVVITADILLADRALKKGAAVIAPNGYSRARRLHAKRHHVVLRCVRTGLRAHRPGVWIYQHNQHVYRQRQA